jgi:hypothetical protein
MKKNISLARSLLLLPLIAPSALLSMEDKDKKLIEESQIIIPEPKKRGLGIWRSCKDLVPLPGWTEEENLYSDLKNKTFDVENSSYHRKLDTAIEIYVNNQNSERIIEIVALCRQNYPKQIKIGDSQARMTHQLLVKQNKEKQLALAKTIQTEDNKFIDKMNTLLNDLQKSVKTQITEMQNTRNTYLGIGEQKGERNNLVEQQCDEIREVKEALINSHKLNKTFTLPDDGYCSDNEEDKKNPENIKISYNNQHILEKIKIADSMQQTTEKINFLLYFLTLFESNLNNIKDIQF